MHRVPLGPGPPDSLVCVCYPHAIINSTSFPFKCPSLGDKLHGPPNNTALKENCLQDPHTPNQWISDCLIWGPSIL